MFTWLKVWWQCQRLSSKDRWDREYAAKVLGQLGDLRAVEPLIKALGDEKENVRQAAAEALVKLGDRRAIEPLVEAMVNVNSEMVVRALVDWGDLRAVEPLIRALGDTTRVGFGYHEARQAAAEALGQLGDPRAVEPLIKTLRDEDFHVRWAAAEALVKLGDRRAIEPLIETMVHHTIVIRALVDWGDPRAVEPLIKALGDGLSCYREAAAKVLGQLGDRRAVEPLIKALRDKDSDVRRAATAALATLGDTRAVEPLIKALGDENENVRLVAAQAIGQLGDLRATEPLIKALGDGLSCDREAAAKALGQLGDLRAIEPLIKALGDCHSDVRLAAAEALARLGEVKWKALILGDGKEYIARLAASGDPRAVEPLIKVLGDVGSDVRRAAAEALARLGEPKWKPRIEGNLGDFARLAASGDPRAVEPLIKALIDALEHSHDDLRRAAAEALVKLGDRRAIELLAGARYSDCHLAAGKMLVKLGDPRAVDLLCKALGGSYADVKQTAAKVLAKLGDPRAIEPLINALGDSDSDVRFVVSNVLARLGEVKWQPLIEGNLGDFARLAASGDPRAFEPLINAFWDSDSDVRCAAAEALGMLGEPRAIKLLIETLGEEIRDVRMAAAEALCNLGQRKWRSIVLGNSDDLGRLAVTMDPLAVSAVVKALYYSSKSWRLLAASALKWIAHSAPDLLRTHWTVVANCVREPHDDSHFDSSGDYHSDGHNDSGIGLDFPGEPPISPAGQAKGPGFGTAAILALACPNCGKKLKAPRHLAGHPACCPSCKTTFQILAQPDAGSNVKRDF